MKWTRVLGILCLGLSLWVLYANVKPYFDAVVFWSGVPILGQLVIPTILPIWFLTYGLMTVAGVGLLIFSVFLIWKK